MSTSNSPDAIVLLRADHHKVKISFKEFEALGDKAYRSKEKIVEQICQELTVHMQAEEEVFYPALYADVKDSADLVNEAIVEHAGAKDLIKQLQNMRAEDEFYDPTVKVLSEQIEHHIEEEEEKIFPLARNSDLDLKFLGQKIEDIKNKAI